ncbi:MAG: PP2C family serine/threonine-protein phosphatase [Candidatus Micrarchaeia archaeon]
MAKFASPPLKDELLEEQLFERKKKDLSALKKESGELLKPDFGRTASELLQDVQYKGIVARAIGRGFEEREYISQKDLEKLMMLSELDPGFGKQIEVKLIPIMKKGRRWEDKESTRLRKEYVKKSQQLLDILSKFQFGGFTKSEEIYLSGDKIFDKTSAYLDFASAVALVDKGVRKRRATKASGSAYFREVYLNGKRGAVFGLFDGFDERGLEYLPSSMSLAIFKESVQHLGSEDALLGILEGFMRNADAKISENVRGFCGASATCGMVFGKKLYYANVGNSRIYGVKANGAVEKLVGDEVASGLGNREQFHSELKYPYFYLGGFTQRMKGKKSFRVIHNEFKLKPPYIGALDVSPYAYIFVANSGVWKSTITMGNVVSLDDGKLSEVFAKARNPLNAMERMDMQVKNFMKEAENKSMVDDIAMLYFTI